MQMAIELPNELWQRVLQQANVQQFIQHAIEKMLAEEQHSPVLLIDMVAKLPEIACFKDKDPLEIQRTIRNEWN